jgi:hypothetical protein
VLAMLCVTAAGATLGACGGASGKLSKAQTIKQADAICQRASDQARQYEAGRVLPTSPEAVIAAIEEDTGIARQAESALRKLDPVSEGRESFDRFVAAQAGIVNANVAQLDASKSRDRDRFQTSSDDLLNATGDSNTAAREYGLGSCPYNPVSAQVGLQAKAQSGTATSQTGSESGGGVVGQWSGRVTQYGPGHTTLRYAVQMNIVGSTPGEIAGAIRYPSLSCGGQLQLSSAQNNSFVYRERITFGRSECFDGGTILATVSGDSMSWRWVARGSEVLGVLSRGGATTAGPQKPD